MKDTRQGNDIRISWSIFKKDGQIFSLEGKNISLYLKSVFGRKELNDFVVTGNIIQWTFYGKDQTNTGKYSLILVVNEGEKGMITTDKCDFVNLVSCSCKLQGGEDAPNVETESIELTSTLEYVSGGGAYDDTALWRALDGKVDKEEGLGLSEENYTTEDKEKLAGLENYDDSGIKEELAKKVESEVVVDTESTEDFEFGYDDTEIRQEIAELSAEVGKKQDTITDLETIRSGASKGATAIQGVKTINGQSIVGKGNIEIQGGGGGTSSDKQGVIRQTQKWTQAADKGYDYVMQNIVRGAIPQANIDLFTSAGAVFNEESGYFELNGLTDISYEEMSAIYNAGYKMVEGYYSNSIRTNIFRPCNVYNSDAALLYGFTGMYANRDCEAESFKFTEKETYGVALKSQMYGTYDGCKYLKTFGKGVFVCQDSNISDQAFTQCYSLETIYLRNLKKNVWFKDSARLSIASVLYMVANSAATSAIVITLHADAYARAMADSEIQTALEAHPNVSLASA